MTSVITKDKISIILVDDHAVVMDGLIEKFREEENFKILSTETNGRDAVDAVRRHFPNIVIMDVSMPDMNGIEATYQILKKRPKTKIIAFSMHIEPHIVIEMFKAGVSGYILKSCSTGELMEAIRTVMEGKIYVCEKINARIDAGTVEDYMESDFNVFSLLSKREREVLQLVSEGHTSIEIAETLDISKKTVDIYRQHLKSKLGLTNVADLTKFAVARGLTSVNI